MENTKLKQEIWAYILLIVGSFLFAAGDVMFVNPYHLAPGGTYGLSNVFYSLWGWKISYWAICMDVPLLIIGTWILGPKFGIKTIVSTFLIFGFTWVLETLWGYKPVIFEGAITSNQISETMIGFSVGGDALNYFTPDYFLNTVVAGLIYGVAIGLIFKSGATSGGSDIISMILHKYTKISLGTLVLIVDGCITISTLFIPGATFRLPIYSIIVIFIESKMIDIVVDGVKSYKTALIITDKVEDVRDYVLNTLHRGGTCFAGMGLFNGAERKMIYVTLERADLVKLKSNLRVLDPNAFVNILDSSEIMGLGFKALPEE
ncbi:MAG: YitT family protein [Bacteroidales bacterium]|nr:YitT family protein [Bacteroidales bacterium]